jgi:hypothetical protein
MAREKGDRESPRGLGQRSPRRTIVGGRPPEKGGEIKGIPSGIQKMLLAASLHDDFRERFLEARGGAAAEIDVPLTDSERAILSAVPESELNQMIERMGVNASIPRRGFLTRSMTALAAFVAAAFTPQAFADERPLGGSRPDWQGAQRTRGISMYYPNFKWCPSIEEALIAAREKKRIVMLVCSGIVVMQDIGHGAAIEVPFPEPDAFDKDESEKLCAFFDQALQKEVYTRSLIPVRTTDSGVHEKYKVTKLPAIIFLDSYNREKARIEQPIDKESIIKTIQKAVR